MANVDSKYTIATANVAVSNNSRITVVTSNMDVRTGQRPREAKEYGGDAGILAKIGKRENGTYENVLARLGSGAGLIIMNPTALFGDLLMTNECDKCFVGPFRDKYAPPRNLCVDTCNGVVESGDPIGEALEEALEAGFWGTADGKEGYFPVTLAGAFGPHQSLITSTQQAAWQKLKSSSYRALPYPVVFYPLGGPDTFNGVPCCISTEKASIEIVIPTGVILPEGLNLGVGISDTEWGFLKKDATEKVILNRYFVAIANRPGKTPLYTTVRGQADAPIIEIGTKSATETIANDKALSVLKAHGFLENLK